MACTFKNDGTQQVTVPNNPSTTCRVKVESVNNTGIFGLNPGNFTIADASDITVTSPNGGESYTTGSSQTITWTDNIAENVKIELFKAGVLNSTIIASTLSDGTHPWIVPGVAAGSDYKIKITSVNNSAINDFSDNNFTISAIPNAPTNLTANAISETQIDINWQDNSSNEDGFKIERSLDGGATWTEIDTVGADEVSYSNTGLTANTEYCYRVRAYNTGGDTPSNEVCATTDSNVPVEPTLVFPANGESEVETSLTLTWMASTGAASYGLQVSLTSNFSSTIYNVTITTTSYPLSNLAENTTYYWQVNASNSGGGTSGYSSPFNFSTVSTVTLSNTINFPSKTNPSDYTSNEYKIVGLLGDDNLNVTSILTGTQGSDWELYWDNGSVTDFYQKYSSSSPFRFTKGRAYWIISKVNLTIDPTVTAARVNEAGFFEIPLLNGFNLITNPFTDPVVWATILTANGLIASTPLNSFSGGWGTSDNMQPYDGYFFDNSTNLSILMIPYPIGASPLPKQTNPDIWRVTVDLTYGEFTDKTTSFGVSIDALDGRDQFDFRKPRALGNIPIVYFYHPGWDNGYGLFATDMRPEFEDEQTWELKVYSELRETEKLTFTGIEEIPGELEIYLLDKDRAKYLNLRENSEYEFTPVKNVSDFQILVGKIGKISSKLNNLIPTEFTLGNNFPNPFNPVTTIPLSVPRTAEIRLVIYNILGQEVKVMFNGTVEAGKHWYIWDGKDDQGFTVLSGIYVYNFISGASINISKKMILMK